MLTVEGLGRRSPEQKEQRLLTDINIKLDAGQCIVVTGESGSGKSLLLRALVDLDPNTGIVKLDARLREDFSAPAWRKQVCYVPPETGWWENLVHDHFPDVDAARDLVISFGLTPSIFAQPVDQLSTGERQRMALVRALLGMPKIILLDEPTSALDAETTSQVEEALRHYLDDGNGLILVTHDQEQARRMGDQFYTMENGQLRAEALQP